MSLDREIKELEKKLKALKIKKHNQGMEGAANSFVQKLREKATPAELKFMEVAQKRGFKFEFQHRINIYDRHGSIKQFFIVDFYDPIYKICFEIDGEYHNTPEQIKKDSIRTKILAKAGYKIYRITNTEVFKGKSISIILSAYNNRRKKH